MCCAPCGRSGIVSFDTVLFLDFLRTVVLENLHLRDERPEEIAFPAIQRIEVVAVHRRFGCVGILVDFCAVHTGADGDGLAIVHELHAQGVEFGNGERGIDCILVVHNLIPSII